MKRLVSFCAAVYASLAFVAAPPVITPGSGWSGDTPNPGGMEYQGTGISGRLPGDKPPLLGMEISPNPFIDHTAVRVLKSTVITGAGASVY